MSTASPLCLVTPRDHDLFVALDRSPLTVRQLLKLSETFAYPFTTERRVQERLQRLCAAGRVRRWPYATAGRGALAYYTLAPLGYRLLHGMDAMPAGRGHFGPVGVARQTHTRALAEVIVQLLVAARQGGIPIENFGRENSVRLRVGEDQLYPDAAFTLRPEPETTFTYYLEIDNRTETVWPGSAWDSWGKKVQFYEKLQDAEEERFRVLVVTTGGETRLENMLDCAKTLARNPRRSLVYGSTLSDLLASEDVFLGGCFQNHHLQTVPLLHQANAGTRHFELTRHAPVRSVGRLPVTASPV